MCEKNIDILEQNPSLSQNSNLHQKYEYYTLKLTDWQHKQIEGFQTRIKTQPRLEPCELNTYFCKFRKKRIKKEKHNQFNGYRRTYQI